jgi:hypothetical protein
MPTDLRKRHSRRSVNPGSYGWVLGLVRRELRVMRRKNFTARDLFVRIRLEPGVVFPSVIHALVRLRQTGEIVVSSKGWGSKPTVFERSTDLSVTTRTKAKGRTTTVAETRGQTIASRLNHSNR